MWPAPAEMRAAYPPTRYAIGGALPHHPRLMSRPQAPPGGLASDVPGCALGGVPMAHMTAPGGGLRRPETAHFATLAGRYGKDTTVGYDRQLAWGSCWEKR